MGFIAAALIAASCGGRTDLVTEIGSSATYKGGAVGNGGVVGKGGAGGNGGTVGKEGASARFNGPEGIFYDGEDNLFIADSENNTIRKMVLATGAVTTLAGSPGNAGSADGTGAAARFHHPSRIVNDGEGGLFITDQYNSTIRRVVIATGAVTTFAGSPEKVGSTDDIARDARFNFPEGMATDGMGDLFVVDRVNYTIRKIVVATGRVTTLAGSVGNFGSRDGTGTDALFSYPAGMVSDGLGDLFVVDEYNHAIRKIVIASAAVTTLAGSGSPSNLGSNDGTGTDARFFYPSDIAIDGKGNLFVADTINGSVRKIVIATGSVTTVAGSAWASGGCIDGTGAKAQFDYPLGIAADGKGNLFVSDCDTIRRVNAATGVVVTIAGLAGVAGGDDSHPG